MRAAGLSAAPQLAELGFYTLGGQPESPRELLDEIRDGEALGLGSEAVLRQLDLGADGVIMHGSSPEELEPVVEEYRALRPSGRFEDLAANPGA